MAGASIETTLELWAASLRDVKARIRPLFTQERVAASAGLVLDGVLGRTPSSVQPLAFRKSANRRLLQRLLDEEARPAACITNATMPVCRRSIPSSTVSSS